MNDLVRRAGLVTAGLAATGLGCLGYGLFVEPAAFRLRRVEVTVLPAGLGPLRVLHLSDLHLLPWQSRKRAWVAQLAALEPDLVINTGDNLAGQESVQPVLDTYGRLLDRPGVFVFGSNDYYQPTMKSPLRYLTGSRKQNVRPAELPWRTLRDGFTTAGWVDLNHQRRVLDVAGVRIEFRGTDDGHLGRDDYSLVAGPPSDDVDLSVGVTHAPYRRLLDAMVADGVQLIFAGHTHGGQVCIPGYGALVTNCDLDTGRVKGLSSHTASGSNGDAPRSAALHVSAGLGMSPYAPYRFACPPEATLLTLTAA